MGGHEPVKRRRVPGSTDCVFMDEGGGEVGEAGDVGEKGDVGTGGGDGRGAGMRTGMKHTIEKVKLGH